VPTAAREQVMAALVAQITAYVGGATVVERNRDVPMDLRAGAECVVVLDGDQAPSDEPAGMGKRMYDGTVTVEGYVRRATPALVGPALSDLYARTLKAAFTDRTLGGLAYDVTDGPLTVEVMREPGTAPGAAFSLELAVRYATSVDDPFVVG
jgi:hypothetical protein